MGEAFVGYAQEAFEAESGGAALLEPDRVAPAIVRSLTAAAGLGDGAEVEDAGVGEERRLAAQAAFLQQEPREGVDFEAFLRLMSEEPWRGCLPGPVRCGLQEVRARLGAERQEQGRAVEPASTVFLKMAREVPWSGRLPWLASHGPFAWR